MFDSSGQIELQVGARQNVGGRTIPILIVTAVIHDAHQQANGSNTWLLTFWLKCMSNTSISRRQLRSARPFQSKPEKKG
jgi:hypothetical protein